MSTPNRQNLSSTKLLSFAASAIIVLIGCLVLVGWSLDIPVLKSLRPELSTIKVNTAIAFIFTGLALWLLNDRNAGQRSRLVARICVLILLLISLLTLGEHLFGWDFGIDQLLFKDSGVGTSLTFPGRMALGTAFAFMMLGLALWSLILARQYIFIQISALIALAIAMLTLVSYLYGVETFYDVLPSLYTGIALLIASMGFLLARPSRGLMAIITNNSPGGVIARRFLTAIILVPLIVGWICLKGQQLGYYGTEFGLALFAVSNITIFAVLVWWNAHLLNQTDSARRQAEGHVRKLNRVYMLLSDINQAIVRTRDMQSLFEKACQIAVDKGGFRMAWIGLLDSETGQLKVAANAGITGNYLDLMIAGLNGKNHPFGSLIDNMRSGKHVISNDLERDSHTTPWKDEKLRLGYRSAAAFPLMIDGTIRGIFSLFASERHFFNEDELRLLDEMAGDIAFAMEFAHQDMQRQQAEAAALETESRYHRVLDNLLEGTQIIGYDWRYLYVNDATAEHGRQAKEALIGHTMMEMYPGIEQTEMFATLQQSMEERIVQYIENEFAYPDGSKAWFQLSVQPVHEGIFILSLDITRRKQAEEIILNANRTLEQRVAERTLELTEAKDQVESILNNSTDGILLISLKLTIRQENAAFCRLFNAQPNDYLDQSLLTLVAPDDVDRAVTAIGTVLAEQRGQSIELRMVRREGTPFEVELSIGYIGSGDERNSGLVCTIRDITERKRVERQLRFSASLQENVTDAVIATDLDFNIQSWNRAAEYIYGYSAQEVIGKPASILQTEFLSQERATDTTLKLRERGAWSGEVIQHHKDHHPIYVLSSTIQFNDEHGTPLGVVAVNRDITERKRIELELQAKTDEERQFQKYLEALHEITIELTQIDQLDDFYRRTVELGLARLGFDRIGLLLYDEEHGTAVGTYGTDAEGHVIDEHDLQFDSVSLADILNRAMETTAHFGYDEHVQLLDRLVPIGMGWNAVAVLRDGDENLGWLSIDNAVHHEPVPTPILDILALYSLTIGTLLVQKKAQRALFESEQRARLMIEGIKDYAIYLLDNNGLVQTWNSGAQQMKGYPESEIIGQSFARFFTPEDQQANKPQQLLVTVEAAGYVEDEGWRVRKDGSRFWVNSVITALRKADGTLYGFAKITHDLTQRRASEEIVRQQRDFLQQVIDSVPEPVSVKDREGRFLLANYSAARVYRTSLPDLIGKNAADLNPNQAQANFTLQSDRETLESGEIAFVPEQHALGRYFQISKIPLKNASGEYDRLLVVATDITERREIEETIRASETRYRLLAENISEVITQIDPQGHYLYISPSIRTTFGYEPDELLGTSGFDLIHPDDMQEVIRMQISAANPDTPNASAIYRMKHKDGHYIWTETSGQVLWSEDKAQVIGFITISRNISARRQAEQTLRESEARYRLLAENITDVISQVSLEGEYLYMSPSSEIVLGYKSEEMVGKTGFEFVHPDDLAEVTTVRTEALANGTNTPLTYRFRHKDGHYLWIEVVRHVILSEDTDEVVGYITSARDITIRKEAEEAMQQAFEKEKELGDLKTRFVSMASHEFRTPLASILATTETLSAYRTKLNDVQIEQRLGKIREQVNHLKDIMEDVLQLARIQARRVEFNPAMIDLDALGRSVIDEFLSQMDQNHPLIYRCDEALRKVSLDRKLMRQVISNLVSNAIKYSVTGKPVTIALEHRGREIILKVRDEGIGIPEADLIHLFEPFHRAANVGAIAGTGLGLTITKESVELHGGTIAVDSVVGVGTTFTVSIPATAGGE